LAVLGEVGFGIWTFEKGSNLVDVKGEVLAVDDPMVDHSFKLEADAFRRK